MFEPAAVNNGTSPRSRSNYEHQVRALSDRLVAAQRPIRILDTVKWDDAIERSFFASGGRELPQVTGDHYASRPLSFDPQRKVQELARLKRDIVRQLGVNDGPSRIMARMCGEYAEVVRLLARRGTPDFVRISEALYGRASDPIYAGGPSLAGFGRKMLSRLGELSPRLSQCERRKSYDARQAVDLLADRLQRHFNKQALVRVRLSDGIVADAAAGSAYLKIRRDARFSARDIRLLEVHEGWVHLATTLNGQRQPVCTFLSKGPPSSTITQEGLAVLMEIAASVAHADRVSRLTHRVEAVAMAEAGADFLEVYRFFLEEGYEPCESYQHSQRVFRGSLPRGCGPFTKDLSYVKGLFVVCEQIHLALGRGQATILPALFCGKSAVSDLPALSQLMEKNIVVPPHFLPPLCKDLETVARRLLPADVFDRSLPACVPPAKASKKAG